MANAPRVALYLSAAHDYDLDAVRAAGLDAVILDLEASVPAAARDTARARLGRWLAEPALARRVVVRVNDLATDDGARDLAALAGEAVVQALLLPGFSQASILPAPFDVRPLWVMIESAAGVAWLEGDQAASSAIEAAVIGYKDLAQDIGVAFDPAEASLAAMGPRILAAARQRGLACYDGVWPGTGPAVGEAARRSVAAGFDGITAYLPGHVPLIRRAIGDGVHGKQD